MSLYAAAIGGYLGMFSGGTPYGWSSAALPLYQRDDTPIFVTDDEGAWIASAFMLGSALGPLMSLVIAHIVGRKTLLLIAAIPWIAGWTMIAFARSPWELVCARLIQGTGTGLGFSVLPMYIGEISPAKIRGILLTIIMMSSRLGILFSYSIVPFTTTQMSALISLSLPIIFVLYFVWLPESPYHCLRLGRRDEAEKSLIHLRGTKDIQEELNRIETSVKAEMANRGGLREILTVPGNRKSLTISVALGLIQQFSGSQAIMMYTQMIFDKANVDLEGKYMAIILGVVQIVCTSLCAMVVDRHGRRPLLLLSSIGSLLSTSVVAAYFNLRHMSIDTSSIEWLPASGCMFYVVFYSLGLASLPITMIGELFPTNVKSLGCAIMISIANVAGFIVGKTYQLITDSVGTHVAFWGFTCCNVLGSIYVYFCVPETKGKTLQEIQDELHQRKCETGKEPA